MSGIYRGILSLFLLLFCAGCASTQSATEADWEACYVHNTRMVEAFEELIEDHTEHELDKIEMRAKVEQQKWEQCSLTLTIRKHGPKKSFQLYEDLCLGGRSFALSDWFSSRGCFLSS